MSVGSSVLTITRPAANTRLVTLAAAAAEIGVAPDDTRLSGWVGQASSMISRYANRVLAQVGVTETFDFDGPLDSVVLTVRPVTAVSAVMLNGAALDLTQILPDPVAGILRFGPLWGGRLAVSYSAGYALPDDAAPTAGAPVPLPLPADISRACLDTVVMLWAGTGRDTTLRSESVTGVGSTTWGDTAATGGLPANAAALVDPYRDIAV